MAKLADAVASSTTAERYVSSNLTSATMDMVDVQYKLHSPSPVQSLGVERKRLAFEAEMKREEHVV